MWFIQLEVVVFFCACGVAYQYGGAKKFQETILFLLVLVLTNAVIILQRLNKMVDIVTNRMFDTINRFSPSQNHQIDSLSTLSNLKRFSRDQRYKKAISREADVRNREHQLYDIKENVPDVQMTRVRPLMGLSCQNCTLTSRESLVNKTTERIALKNMFSFTPCINPRSFLHRNLCHIFQTLKLKQFDYKIIDKTVLGDERVIQAVEKTSREQFSDSDNKDDEFYQELLQKNRERALKLLNDMKSSISDYVLRCTSWLMHKLLPCFISSVLVHPGQINMIKEASKSSLPLIFLPLHRSHLDYILITFILLNNNIKSPLVAAGDNLRIPFFGSLLRGLGAFYIKRRIDPIQGHKDHVYKAILHTYMNQSLKAGHNIEFFIEGGRTRTGKPIMPKYGIFSVILDSFMDGTIEDALLVPVSINYDKIVDGNFIKEQLGEPKKMESFGNTVRALWKVINCDYGMARVDFNQPFSLRELVKSFSNSGKILANKKVLTTNPSTMSLYGTDCVSDEHKMLIETISRHVVYDSTQSTSIMATNIVSFLLLYRYREGGTFSELVTALDSIRCDLEYCRRDIAFQGDSVDVINYAVDMLGSGLVRKEKQNSEDFIKPVAILPNVIELSYYANTLVPFYSLDSIVALSLSAMKTQSGKINSHILMENSLELCDIMQYEFIFCKPCQSLEQTVNASIDDLVIRKHVFEKDDESAINLRSRRIASQFEDEEEDHDVPTYYSLSQDESAQEYLAFLKGIVLPLVECYSITAFTLEKLVGRSLMESELVQEVLKKLKGQLEAKSLKCDEAVSVDTIKNALKLLLKWEILECHNEGKLRLFYLRESQDDSESVSIVYNRINKYRGLIE